MNETQIAIARIDVMMGELKLMKARLVESELLATGSITKREGIEDKILEKIKDGVSRTAIIKGLSAELNERRVAIQISLEQMIARGEISRDMTKRKNNAHIYIIN